VITTKKREAYASFGAAPVISAYLPIAGNGTYSRFHRACCRRLRIYAFLIVIYTTCSRITGCSFNRIPRNSDKNFLAEISWMGNYLYIANIFTNSAKANLKWMTNVTLLIYSIYPIYVYLLIIPTKLSLFPSILRLKNAG